MMQLRRRIAVLDDEVTQPGVPCDEGSALLGNLWHASQAERGSGASCPWCASRAALGVAERGAYRWQCVRCGWLSEWFSVVAGAPCALERPPNANDLVYRDEMSGVRPLPGRRAFGSRRPSSQRAKRK